MEGQKKDKKLQDGNIASSNLVLVVEGRGGPGWCSSPTRSEYV